MNVSTSSSQIIATLCQQLNIDSFPQPPPLSSSCPIAISVGAWGKLQFFDPTPMLQHVFSLNTLHPRVGLLLGQYTLDNVAVVHDVHQVAQSSPATAIQTIVQQILTGGHQQQQAIVGWCIFTTGTGIGIPATQLDQITACVGTLDCIPSALACLLVVDVMKASTTSEEGAHLECYDLNFQNGKPTPLARQWSVDEETVV